MTRERNLQSAASSTPEERDILAGFFYVSSNSMLDVASTTVKRVTGKIGGAAMIMTSSDFNIRDGS